MTKPTPHVLSTGFCTSHFQPVYQVKSTRFRLFLKIQASRNLKYHKTVIIPPLRVIHHLVYMNGHRHHG